MNRYLSIWTTQLRTVLAQIGRSQLNALIVIGLVTLVSSSIFYSLGQDKYDHNYFGSGALTFFILLGFFYGLSVVGRSRAVAVSNITRNISLITQIIQAVLLGVYLSAIVLIPWILANVDGSRVGVIFLVELTTILLILLGLTFSLIIRHFFKSTAMRFIFLVAALYVIIIAWPVTVFLNEQLITAGTLDTQATFVLFLALTSSIFTATFILDLLIQHQTISKDLPPSYWSALTKYPLTKFATNAITASFIKEVIRILRDARLQRYVSIFFIVSVLTSYSLITSGASNIIIITTTQGLVILSLMAVNALQSSQGSPTTSAYLARGLAATVVGLVISWLVLLFYSHEPSFTVIFPGIILTHTSWFIFFNVGRPSIQVISLAGLVVVAATGFLSQYSEPWLVGSMLMIWVISLATILFLLIRVNK